MLQILNKKMKEYCQVNQQDKKVNPCPSAHWKGPVRKYSIDVEKEVARPSPNLFSFSGINDDHFLNPASFGSFEDLPQANCEGLPGYLSNTSLNSPTCLSPSTPNSFGFSKTPSRQATVNIENERFQRRFSHVQIFMVNDQLDPGKAGLIFKYEQKDVDLKIDKKQGKELERMGRLENTWCQLWVDQFSQWVEVRAQIHLED